MTYLLIERKHVDAQCHQECCHSQQPHDDESNAKNLSRSFDCSWMMESNGEKNQNACDEKQDSRQDDGVAPCIGTPRSILMSHRYLPTLLERTNADFCLNMRVFSRAFSPFVPVQNMLALAFPPGSLPFFLCLQTRACRNDGGADSFLASGSVKQRHQLPRIGLHVKVRIGGEERGNSVNGFSDSHCHHAQVECSKLPFFLPLAQEGL